MEDGASLVHGHPDLRIGANCNLKSSLKEKKPPKTMKIFNPLGTESGFGSLSYRPKEMFLSTTPIAISL